MMDVTSILSLLIQLIFAILGTIAIWGIKQYFLPWLESKLSANEFNALRELAQTMIKAAEQLEENGYFDGVENIAQAKKAYVLQRIKEQVEKWGFTFDEAVISDVIEGLIKESKKDLNEDQPTVIPE